MAHSKRIFCLNKENKFIINTEDISTGMKMMKNSKLYKNDTKNIAYDMLYT